MNTLKYEEWSSHASFSQAPLFAHQVPVSVLPQFFQHFWRSDLVWRVGGLGWAMLVSSFKQSAGSHNLSGIFSKVLSQICLFIEVDMALMSQMRRWEPQRVKDLSKKGLWNSQNLRSPRESGGNTRKQKSAILLFYCTSQKLHFLQIEGKTLTSKKVTHFIVVVWDWTHKLSKAGVSNSFSPGAVSASQLPSKGWM